MVVGGVAVVVESHSYPCLSVDAVVATTTLKSVGVGDVVCWKRMKKQYLVRRTGGSMELMSTSFLDPLCVTTSFKKKKQRRDRRFTIVNELGGQYEDTFNDVKTQIVNYFTYKAVRTVLQQLYEMNPPQYRWFYNFVATNNPSDGRRFLRSLGKEQHELAERVMVTRLHLYSKWIKKCNHAEIYKEISDENLELMRERLMETVIWPSDDTNTEKIG